VCFSAFNVAAAFKKQHVQPMYDKFNQVNAELQTVQKERATGQRQGNAEFVLDADFRLFAAPSAPIETLKELVFNKISAQGRPLALVAILEQSFNGVKDAVMKRDALAQRFESGAITQNLLAKCYFGIRLPSGHTNHEFPDLVAAIHSYTDDVVFFSSLLCTDLIEHGARVRTEFRKKYGEVGPGMSTIDFSKLRKDGVIPPEAEYAGWLSAFTTDAVQAKKGTTVGN
jgi:hypothetical protein